MNWQVVKDLVKYGREQELSLIHIWMPALLIETGFINSEEDNKLFDNKFSDIAQGIADAILGSLDEETVQAVSYTHLDVYKRQSLQALLLLK